MNELDYFAKNLKYLRQKHNLKQEDIASLFYVTSQAVSKWETSKSMPDIKMLIKIAEYFHYSVEDLITKDIETLTPKEDDEPKKEKEEEVKKVSPIYRNLNEIKDKKAGKPFFINLIILLVLIILSYVTLFVPLDNVSIVLVIVLAVVNSLALVQVIRSLVKYQKNILIRHDSFFHIFKVAAPLNFAVSIYFLSVGLIFTDFVEPEMLGLTVYFISFMILFIFVGTSMCLMNVFYHKVENTL